MALAAGRAQRPSGSMAGAFARHGLIFVASTAATMALTAVAPADEQPVTWIVAGLAAGMVASLLARGFWGYAVLTTGQIVGIGLDLQLRAGGIVTPEQAGALPIYLAALASAALGYILGRLAAGRS